MEKAGIKPSSTCLLAMLDPPRHRLSSIFKSSIWDCFRFALAWKKLLRKKFFSQKVTEKKVFLVTRGGEKFDDKQNTWWPFRIRYWKSFLSRKKSLRRVSYSSLSISQNCHSFSISAFSLSLCLWVFPVGLPVCLFDCLSLCFLSICLSLSLVRAFYLDLSVLFLLYHYILASSLSISLSLIFSPSIPNSKFVSLC